MIPRPNAAALLTWAASFDNREVTEAAATAWADALDDRVNLDDGKAAISAHYAADPRWVMPAHVNQRVAAIRADRLARMATPQPPEALDGNPARELDWQRAYRAAIGSGATPDQADTIACQALGIPLPEPVLVAPRPPELETFTAGAVCEHACLTAPNRDQERAA